MLKKIIGLVSLAVCSVSQTGFSWCDAGHMIVAEIAQRNLNPEAKVFVEKMNQEIAKSQPQLGSIYQAATYPDKTEEYPELWFWDVWHHTNIPYDPYGILSDEQKQEIIENNKKSDVIFGLNHAKEALLSSSEKDWYMYAYLLHFVADIHQPLHCSSCYSKENPEGDRGGNLFLLSGVKYKNLHCFWDFGLGLLSEVRSGEDADEYIQGKACELMAKYPRDFFDLNESNIEQWAQESAFIAHHFSYRLQEKQTPPDSYIQFGQQIAECRLTQAGYRLANLINEIASQRADSSSH